MILCGQQVKTTGFPGVFYSGENSELKTGNPKVTMKTFLSSIVDTFNFELLKERKVFLMKIRTLQCEIKRLKIQTMIEISKNIVSPSLTLFGKRTHVERAESVLYVHKCAKMVAAKTKLPFCTRKSSCVSIVSELFFY